MSSEVQRAREVQPQWAATPVKERVAALHRLRSVIASRMDDLVVTLSVEIGKPQMDAMAGDVMVVLEMLRFYEQHAVQALRPLRSRKPALLFAGTSFTERYEPYGVALIIAPWNYPFQLAMVPAITALVAGNAVIVKCSEHAPQTAAAIASVFREAGFPENLVQVSAASGAATEEMIAGHPDIIFFTGSSRVGIRVAQQAAGLLIPTVLELGGKDACLVFASCNLARAIEGICYGAFSNAGQVCLGVKRIYVQRPLWDSFLVGFTGRANALRIGDGLDADMGEIRLPFLRTLIREQVEDALSRGACLHTAWDRASSTISPLILTDVPRDARLLTDESFGPVVCIAPFDTEDEAIRMANDSPFALGSSIFTGDSAQAQRVAAAMHAGSCTINDCIRSAGNPYAAFGGNGQSGNGRYHGLAGLRAFTRTKTIMQASARRGREVHWFPFTPSTYRALRAFMVLRHSFRTPFQALRRSLQRIP